MFFEDIKILELNQYGKFDEKVSIVYVDLESLIEKVDEF